jgi:hypothetical protein
MNPITVGEKFRFTSTCPNCLEVATGMAGIDGVETPDPGSLNICRFCAGLAIFDEGLKLRKLTTAETVELVNSDDWPRISRLVSAAHLARTKGRYPR